jgi:hypothetical protein
VHSLDTLVVAIAGSVRAYVANMRGGETVFLVDTDTPIAFLPSV